MILLLLHIILASSAKFPIVINTWGDAFANATQAAWDTLSRTGDNLEAVVSGCLYCEVNQCGGTVGYGGSPDESGETTLDAMIMNGATFEMGAVSDLRQVKNAIGVARAVMQYTTHTMLAGESATTFATQMGFPIQNLSTPDSVQMHQTWLANNCQPNFRKNVSPDPTKYCGPYTPLPTSKLQEQTRNAPSNFNEESHDTISMVVIDGKLNVAAGTSTNGARNKIPGRVGDGPIPGSGSYADNTVGGCGSTGDGDVMMRFLPCANIVELMRQGYKPTDACEKVLSKIRSYFPTFAGAVVAVNIYGDYGAAALGWEGTFQYSVRTADMTAVQIVDVPNFI